MGTHPAFGKVTRRAAMRGLAALFAAPLIGGAPRAVRAAGGPAVAYMKSRVKNDLFAAARAKTTDSFLRAINRHADLDAIARYSLGTYSSRLTPPMSNRLRRGVAGFMARYFAIQANDYPVVRADFLGEYPYGEDDVVVQTRIQLKSGASYSVDWLMSARGHGYKIRDVRVYGLWLSPFQRALFTRYIAENGGDLTALLAALRV
ncbi:MAG: ABC transporter substrate-binding protein [Hyphomicrobiales bacterium]|jgi:phospholipid transport system substrate-binding protein|nr:ABC transporter substrate-binding protein [Hyphomicrobiales bacterium]